MAQKRHLNYLGYESYDSYGDAKLPSGQAPGALNIGLKKE
jgi:hypothetical protein